MASLSCRIPVLNKCKARSETVTIVLPDGKRRKANATLSVAHVNSGPCGIVR
jgi:hypothetical protein